MKGIANLTILSLLRALHKALISRGYSSAVATPRGLNVAGSLSTMNNNLSFYPSDIAFANVDLVTTQDDEEIVVKARKAIKLFGTHVSTRYYISRKEDKKSEISLRLSPTLRILWQSCRLVAIWSKIKLLRG